MDAGSIIAVTGAQIVALVAIGAGFWQQRQGFANERELADLESVRELMSQAAAVLHRVEYALDQANATLNEWGRGFFEDEERARPYRELEVIGREADAVLGQLRIRLGPEHPATLAFGDADAAMLDVFRALGLIKMEDIPRERGFFAGRKVTEILEELCDRVARGRENFGIAQEQFVAEAHTAAGAKL